MHTCPTTPKTKSLMKATMGTPKVFLENAGTMHMLTMGLETDSLNKSTKGHEVKKLCRASAAKVSGNGPAKAKQQNYTITP